MIDNTALDGNGGGNIPSVEDIRLSEIMKNPNVPTRVLISYAFYSREHESTVVSSGNGRVYRICRQNLDIFLERGLHDLSSIDYVFAVIGDTRIPPSLASASIEYSNVKIKRFPNEVYDLLTHRRVLEGSGSNYDHYMILNCGIRGPYINKALKGNAYGKGTISTVKFHPVHWVHSFTSALNVGAGAVGATISHEISTHIQSYAMAFTRNVKQIAVEHWGNFTLHGNGAYGTANRGDAIKYLEVMLSTAIINQGYRIASLDSRYFWLGQPEEHTVKYTDFRANPVSCMNTPGGYSLLF